MKKRKVLNQNGFIVSGVVYSILILFVILLSTLLMMLANRKHILDQSKQDLLKEMNEADRSKYKVYADGTIVYFNPEYNATCEFKNASSSTGTKTGCMKWHTFNDEGGNAAEVTMILDHNTTVGVVWNTNYSSETMGEAQTALNRDTKSWDRSLNPRVIQAEEVAKITKNTLSYDGFTFNDGSFHWLYNYTRGCKSYGCQFEDASTNGYWTSTKASSYQAYYISMLGKLTYSPADHSFACGIRPVITVSKTLLD